MHDPTLQVVMSACSSDTETPQTDMSVIARLNDESVNVDTGCG